ncbi:hypothetical protein AT15_08370 [Kosmotoga arenicorallina S304]|uniref:Coenzyme F420:L-glutamate ligase-like domain-containing protein n=1 Tax=Kosmotoga arenicorallina S304 TaxID=1453497 RepID=A0A176K232_9BACT|nr:coenzyme F420-0:L-glutamate ligase [Kosmotoga arenicorallina]OAA30985.1 hypothetical protein AT15_08370 [Kosmotoga arenicorallina S304]
MVKIIPIRFSKPVVPSDASDSSLEQRLAEELKKNDITLENKDILVVTSKIVSLLEGNTVDISSIKPRKRIKFLARLFSMDPQRLELVFREGKVLGIVPLRKIMNDRFIRNFYLKHSRNINATQEMLKKNFINVPMTSRLGLIFDNAGIDGSNIPDGFLAPLPENPCLSAKKIKDHFKNVFNKEIAVIITDTLSVLNRTGALDVCIGCSGIYPITINESGPDLFKPNKFGGNMVTVDAVAAIAGAVMGGNTQLTPAVILKGFEYESWNDNGDCKEYQNVISFPTRSKIRAGFYTVLNTILFKTIQFLLFLKSGK